ncbi:hypothetical protein L7F22_065126 [Adiantum nelumboides]|nr:hypothetical protein [Adiantum nelumboides]
MRTYVQALQPKTIAAVIHYTRVAYKIFKPKNPPNKGDKGKDKENGSSNVKSNNKKQASKRPYQGTNRLSPEEMERYRKENRCFRCGTTGHTYRECPQRNTKRETPKVSNVITPSFDDFQEANELCYAWGKIRDQHALILMDPGSTHNIISTELAEKLGIKVGEMGPALEAKGAFKGQEVAVTPLIGKLRVHVQSFVEAEEFYVAPLESHDVILGVLWFHRKHAKLIFPERLITLSHKGKDIVIRTHKKGDTIPLVNHIAFEKSMKSSLSSYMIFVRDFKSEKANEPMLDASLKSFLNEHAHCFSETIPVELPPSRGVDDHRIDLIPGTSPPNRPPYRVSLAQQEEIMSQVNELLEKGMVQPSSSPFCSPVLLVQKKDGSYRMCVDYRALNKSTIKNRFSVPRIEDIFDRLQGSSYYSRIDLKSGYHQIRIVPEDIHKTAFRTTFGLYEFLVMPFGLTNAPATFNRMMDRIFRPHRSYTGVFFHDIIVYSKTLEEHKEHLKKVFEELHRNKLFINGKKSEFFLQEIRYLGHIISKDGIKMDPEKLKVIEEWPQPKNLHELRSFIGMCAYYRRFIEKFSVIAGPLHDLTKKEAADKHRRHLDLKEDDCVLLKFPKARLQHTTGKDRQGTPNGHQKFYAKLAKRFYGPFQILQKINPTAFRLKLPDHWHIHNAFHASLLKPYKGTPLAAPIEEDPPEFDEMEEILRPEKILKHEDKVLRTGKILRRYLVKFANYPDEDARWMQEPQLKESLALLQEYKAMYNLQDTQ